MDPNQRPVLHNFYRDRVIRNCPQPLLPHVCPSGRTDFNPAVRTACHSSKSHLGDTCKVVIVGDISVGKTALLHRFCHNIFSRDYKATIGVDFEVERFHIFGVPFTLHLWDTAGQEKFKSIASAYYRGAHAVLVVFDMTNRYSMNNCKKWLEEACTVSSNPVKFLIGTKRDILTRSEWNDLQDLAAECANELSCELWITSAKTGENVDALFFRVAALTFDSAMLRSLESTSNGRTSIGSELIRIDRDRCKNMFEPDVSHSTKNRFKSRCCKT